MRILHLVPGLKEEWNGIAVAARLIAGGQRQEGHDVGLADVASFTAPSLACAEEVWVHSMWTPAVWRACLMTLKRRTPHGVPRLVRMTHANLDPIRYRHHGWKKRLVAPVERWLFAKTDRVVVTGAWEADWCRTWGVRNEIEIIDLRRFFDLKVKKSWEVVPRTDGSLHVLYLGRKHPLKGVRYLEQAVREANGQCSPSPEAVPPIRLRAESSLFGAAKEAAWEWCDVFCLPTISENFGLVVAEALEHGRRVIVTDGAPAWASSPEAGRVCYLRGYRDGTDAVRVALLKGALLDVLAVDTKVTRT